MFTRFRTGALVPCVLLFLLAVGLIYKGDTCAAAALAGVIGVIGTKFADVPDDAIRGGDLRDRRYR